MIIWYAFFFFKILCYASFIFLFLVTGRGNLDMIYHPSTYHLCYLREIIFYLLLSTLVRPLHFGLCKWSASFVNVILNSFFFNNNIYCFFWLITIFIVHKRLIWFKKNSGIWWSTFFGSTDSYIAGKKPKGPKPTMKGTW